MTQSVKSNSGQILVSVAKAPKPGEPTDLQSGRAAHVEVAFYIGIFRAVGIIRMGKCCFSYSVCV